MKMEYQMGFLLSRAAWAMNNLVNRYLKENGLADVSVSYFAVLNALWENDGLSISDLGEKVQLEKSTMTLPSESPCWRFKPANWNMSPMHRGRFPPSSAR